MRVDQRGRLTFAFEQFDAGRQCPVQASRDRQPGCVVAADRVAERRMADVGRLRTVLLPGRP